MGILEINDKQIMFQQRDEIVAIEALVRIHYGFAHRQRQYLEMKVGISCPKMRYLVT